MVAASPLLLSVVTDVSSLGESPGSWQGRGSHKEILLFCANSSAFFNLGCLICLIVLDFKLHFIMCEFEAILVFFFGGGWILEVATETCN